MPNYYIADSEQELNEHNEQLAQIEQADLEIECEYCGATIGVGESKCAFKQFNCMVNKKAI